MIDSLIRGREWGIAAIGLVIALVIPFIVQWGGFPSYWLHVVIVGYFYAMLASSWALLAGYAGQFSFAHMAFMAIGGYTSGLLGQFLGFAPIPGIIAGVLLAGVFGLIIGALCLRFKPAYLALFTIAFSEILRAILRGEADITRGDSGLSLQPLFGDTLSRVPYYYLWVVVLVASLLFMYWIANSRLGLFMRAIREDEEAAAARGVDVVRYKIMAFVVTSMIAGLAGGIFAHYVTIISPNILVLPQMGLVMAMAIIGGVESLIAAAIGAILIQLGLEVLREFGAWRLVIFGALLVLTLRFARNGLITPLLNRLFSLGPRAEARTAKATEEAVS